MATIDIKKAKKRSRSVASIFNSIHKKFTNLTKKQSSFNEVPKKVEDVCHRCPEHQNQIFNTYIKKSDLIPRRDIPFLYDDRKYNAEKYNIPNFEMQDDPFMNKEWFRKRTIKFEDNNMLESKFSGLNLSYSSISQLSSDASNNEELKQVKKKCATPDQSLNCVIHSNEGGDVHPSFMIHERDIKKFDDIDEKIDNIEKILNCEASSSDGVVYLSEPSIGKSGDTWIKKDDGRKMSVKYVYFEGNKSGSNDDSTQTVFSDKESSVETVSSSFKFTRSLSGKPPLPPQVVEFDQDEQLTSNVNEVSRGRALQRTGRGCRNRVSSVDHVRQVFEKIEFNSQKGSPGIYSNADNDEGVITICMTLKKFVNSKTLLIRMERAYETIVFRDVHSQSHMGIPVGQLGEIFSKLGLSRRYFNNIRLRAVLRLLDLQSATRISFPQFVSALQNFNLPQTYNWS